MLVSRYHQYIIIIISIFHPSPHVGDLRTYQKHISTFMRRWFSPQKYRMVFNQCVESVPTKHSEEFGYLLIYSVNCGL